MNSINRAFIVGLISQATQILSRLLLIPFFITIFGVEKYGAWIYINSIAIFLSVTDLGLNSASLNRLFRLRNDNYKFHLLYNNILSFFICLSFLLALISISLLYIINIFIEIDYFYSLIVLLLFYSSQYFCNYIVNYLQAIGRQATDGILNIIISITQIFSLIISGYFWKSILISSIFYCIPLALVSLIVYIKYLKHVFHFSFKFIPDLKNVFSEAVGFSKAQLAQYLSNNGPIFAIKFFMSFEMVALFSIYRTVTNLSLRLISVYPQSAWPTLTYTAASSNEKSIYKKIINTSYFIAITISFISIIYITFYGEYLFNKILNIQNFSLGLAFSFLLCSLLSGYNSIYLIFLSAVGKINNIYNLYILLMIIIIFILMYNSNISLSIININLILLLIEGIILNFFILYEFNKLNMFHVSYLKNIIIIIFFIMILFSISQIY